MLKRAHPSSSPLPASKRICLSKDTHAVVKRPPNLDLLLSDEVFLSIFAHLSWIDLCVVQAINKYWARLALDNQLWKALYVQEYGRTRLRGFQGFIGRGDGREIKPLPGRAQSETVTDWKWMFRISSNWRTGRCATEQLDGRTREPSPSLPSPESSYPDGTHILIAGALTITASSRLSLAPELKISSPSWGDHTLPCPPVMNATQSEITCLSLDQSPATGHTFIRFAVFYSSGEISIFQLNVSTSQASLSRTGTYVPHVKTPRCAPITRAAYHHPLLVTLSESFQLSLYDLSAAPAHITHTQTLNSYTSFPPTSLVLTTPSPTTFKLVVAYAVPVFPEHWSVAATEVTISRADPSTTVSVRPIVQNMRTTRAFEAPPGWVDETQLRVLREQWHRRVAGVADTQTDGKWVVLAPSSATVATQSEPLQLYRLLLPTPRSSTSNSSSSPSAVTPKLTFVRNLQGQSGRVTALALADGRCVSLSADGSVWVWDLENDWGVEVQARRTSGTESSTVDHGSEHGAGTKAKGTVVFNERRILYTGSGTSGVDVLRFDI